MPQTRPTPNEILEMIEENNAITNVQNSVKQPQSKSNIDTRKSTCCCLL